MDLLQDCAMAFDKLMAFEYRFTIGRKGKALSFSLDFDPADFHHLAGLHKLKDNVRFLTGKRADIFREALHGRLTYRQAAGSAYFSEIESRLPPLLRLESFLDSNEIIFRFNEKAQKFSLIQADYLLENRDEENAVYLFLVSRDGGDKKFRARQYPAWSSWACVKKIYSICWGSICLFASSFLKCTNPSSYPVSISTYPSSIGYILYDSVSYIDHIPALHLLSVTNINSNFHFDILKLPTCWTVMN